jgi:hypothetical protein
MSPAPINAAAVAPSSRFVFAESPACQVAWKRSMASSRLSVHTCRAELSASATGAARRSGKASHAWPISSNLVSSASGQV